MNEAIDMMSGGPGGEVAESPRPAEQGILDGLPSAQLLSEYERLVPGSAAEFLKLRLQQMELEHKQNAAKLQLHHEEFVMGRRYALILGVLGVVLAFAGSILSLHVLNTFGGVTLAEAVLSLAPGAFGVSGSAYFLRSRVQAKRSAK